MLCDVFDVQINRHAKEADEDDALTYSEYLLWKARMGSNDPAWC